MKQEQQSGQIAGSRCWLCGLGRLESQGARETGGFSPASHTLDDDDPHVFMSGLTRIEDLFCPACNTRFQKVDDEPLRIKSIPFADLGDGTNLTTDARHRNLEERLWMPASCPAALEAFQTEPWDEWKRRFWLRAATASGNLLVMSALLRLKTPLITQLPWAIFNKQETAANLLLDHGADPYEDLSFQTLGAKLGQNFMAYGPESLEVGTVFRLALIYKQFSLAGRMIKQGMTGFTESDVSRASSIPRNQTVLPGQREVVRLLLSRGLSGHAALYDALEHNKERSVRLLCEAGVDLRAFCIQRTLDPILERLEEPILRVFCKHLVQALNQMK